MEELTIIGRGFYAYINLIINMLQAIKIIILFSLFCPSFTQVTCHYSCNICAGDFYTLCANCSDSSASLTVVEDPSLVPQQFKNSQTKTGVCIGKVPSDGVNALGIVVLIIGLLTMIITRTKKSVFLFYTLQTFALVSFVEVAWINPTNYILQSLQYYMIFNIMGSSYKIEDQTMKQRQYYRLHEYFKESQFLPNIAIIGIFNILVFAALLFFTIYKRKNYPTPIQETDDANMQGMKKQNLQVNEIQSDREMMNKPEQPRLSEKIVNVGLMISQVFFFLMIQETLVVMMVALRFNEPSAPETVSCSILYLLMLLFFLVSTFWEPAWFFPNKPTQYICWWRKIGLPVFVIVPITVTYLLIIFLIIFAIIESFFDFRSGEFKLASRITLYKFLQLVLIIFCAAYVGVQMNINLIISTEIITIIVSIGVIALYVCWLVQIVLGIKQTYFDNKNQVANEEAVKYQQAENQEVTQYCIDYAHNFTNDTLADDLKRKQEERLKEQEERRRKLAQEQEENRRLEEMQRKKRQEEQQRKRNEQLERKRKQEQEERRRKEEEDQKRKEEEDRQREERQKLKKQQLQRKRKEEQERKRLEQEERKRKQEQLKKRLEEQRRRRQEEERLQRQQLERIKKQEEEQKERKRKNYKGMMDPELRKRYGF